MSSFKECFKCGLTLDINSFYKHFGMKDGYLNKCKDCCKKDEHARRLSKLGEIRAYDRNRKNKQQRYAYSVERTRNRRKEDSRYMRAHNAVYRAIKKGVLERLPCEKCARETNVHAHHDDYDKPLDVMWLCPPCHRKRHDELAMMNKDVF